VSRSADRPKTTRRLWKRRTRARPGVQDRNSLIGYNRLTPYLFSGPAILTVTLLLGFPVLFALYGSLFRAEFLGAPAVFVGLDNYTELLGDPDFLHALTRTVIFVAGCLIVGTFLSLVFAFALNRAVRRLRFFRAITIAPYIVSSVAAAVMFRIFFNREFGQLNQVIELFGLEGLPWLTSPTLAMVVVILAQVWTDLPLSILLLLGGLQTIDESYLDAAEVDGASGWNRARFISIPLIAPQLAISTVWLSYATLTSLGVVLALTRGGPSRATQTLPVEMYETAFIRFETEQALAIVVVILVLNAVLTLSYIALSRRYEVAN
jgi:multiple sugar transport system permease protein